ncbi:MAG: glutamyl-tRNA reductase [Polyangiaceae bacterium]|nr:glutamyl-tRNA reductase [Polyangiaceae bacterium]
MIVVVGLSHKTAPIAVRERLAIDKERAQALLRGCATGNIGEAILLSTCNRVELFVAGKEGREADLPLVAKEAVAQLTHSAPEVAAHLYTHSGNLAVQHLFRVASSLDSMVLGEPQILGQLKQAYENARECGTVGASLHRAVTRALRTAKRVRTETNIGAGQVSVPSVAVDLAKQIFGDLTGKRALLIGSGEMAEAAAKLLGAAGARLWVLGRNTERAAEIAKTVGGQPRAWEELLASLKEADMVITSTSAPHYVVTLEMLKEAYRFRRERSLFLIDLAVPRDIDPETNNLDGVFLYNVDDLSKVVSDSLDARKQEAERAESIIQNEALQFDRWVETMQVTPTIVALRERFRLVLEGELDRSLRGRLKHLGNAEREALARMLEASLNKLMHAPSTFLKKAASEPTLEETPLELLLSTVSSAFALDDENELASLRATELDSNPTHTPPKAQPSAHPSTGEK